MTSAIELLVDGGFYEIQNAEVLVVLLHAYNSTPASLQRMAEIAREQYPRSDIYAPRLPVKLFSRSDPKHVARGIVEYLGRLPRIASYACIILVGHSLGAVLARKVWALAHGAAPDGKVNACDALEWASRIKRIVLVAALNRGWTVSSALSPADRLLWTIGTAWGNFCRHVLRQELLVFGFRRGSPFLTTVRLQCLAVDEFLRDKEQKPPIIVQLLGTADDFIAPTDNVDLATGRSFFYIEIDGATHSGVVDLEGEEAECKFRLALKGDAEALGAKALPMQDVFDGCDETDDYDASILPLQNAKVKHVVFVIHGIRDRGFWTRRIARVVKSMAREKEKDELCRSVTSTYGFFPMGPFLLPWIRRNKVEWLLDQYVAAKSLYPDAKFSYIGHSNGTYLLAKALEICPAIRFEDGVVFCGSMVRHRYDWNKYIPARVSRMVNYVATADWVVAIFPHGLESMKLQDVGGAGHVGFDDPEAANIRYVEGHHSAALVPSKWKEMAAFVLGEGTPPKPLESISQDKTTVRLGRLAPALWLIILIGVLAIGWAILRPLGLHGAALAVLFSFYLYALRVFLTRA
jgi:pimeloyl-ACP methyl ester carboxylesterase